MNEMFKTEEPWPIHGCANEVCEACKHERRQRGMEVDWPTGGPTPRRKESA